MLTDIDGLYDADPRGNPEARLIPEVREIDDALFSLAGDSGSNRGTGGMVTSCTPRRWRKTPASPR